MLRGLPCLVERGKQDEPSQLLVLELLRDGHSSEQGCADRFVAAGLFAELLGENVAGDLLTGQCEEAGDCFGASLGPTIRTRS